MNFLIRATAISVWLGALPLSAQSFKPETSYHSDYRNTPSQEFIKPNVGELSAQPKAAMRSILSPDTHVLSFLKENASRYGFDANLADVRQVEKQKSLLGTHYRFQQYFNDKEVITGQIVVSTDKDGNVTEVSNNIFPPPQNKSGIARDAKITRDQAFDIVWNDLHIPQGVKLTEEPLADLKYFPIGGGFRLVYDIQISANRPIDSWEYAVAADTGDIVKKQKRVTNLDKYDDAAIPQGPLADRSQIFGNYATESQAKRTMSKTRAVGFVERASGQANAFDPDPVTSLKDDTLTLNSPAAKFDGAYATVTLKDLKKENGVYFLEGPWVKIVDKEEPSTPPSTSRDGIWHAKRGDNAFDDVMVYYHIDAAQRYLQSLGFTSLIARPIEADSDGLRGEDNSHHVPSQDGKSGYLAFGHGGVPDPEDASVIWHEYGHAVHAEIVGKNWAGGDSQALGEGFGDYWAASYNYSTVNGAYKQNRLFKWDGVLWGGRGLEAKDYKYDPARIYNVAHEPIDNAAQRSPDTSELWSSPLFQALVTLSAQGHKRQEADSIVVQSLFGLKTSGFTMRDVAQKVIATAQQLYPDGPHWKVYLAKFQEYNICPPNVADACSNEAPAMAKNETGGATPGEGSAKK